MSFKKLDKIINETVRGIKRLKLSEIYLMFLSFQSLLLTLSIVPFSSDYVYMITLVLVGITYIIVIKRGEKK